MATVTVRTGSTCSAALETMEAIKTKPELAEFTFRSGAASTLDVDLDVALLKS